MRWCILNDKVSLEPRISTSQMLTTISLWKDTNVELFSGHMSCFKPSNLIKRLKKQESLQTHLLLFLSAPVVVKHQGVSGLLLGQ